MKKIKAKMRIGFVSNSSSSSFIIGVNEEPLNPKDIAKIIGTDITLSDSYHKEDFTNDEVCEKLFNDMKIFNDLDDAKDEVSSGDEPDYITLEKGKRDELLELTNKYSSELIEYLSNLDILAEFKKDDILVLPLTPPYEYEEIQLKMVGNIIEDYKKDRYVKSCLVTLCSSFLIDLISKDAVDMQNKLKKERGIENSPVSQFNKHIKKNGINLETLSYEEQKTLRREIRLKWLDEIEKVKYELFLSNDEKELIKDVKKKLNDLRERYTKETTEFKTNTFSENSNFFMTFTYGDDDAIDGMFEHGNIFRNTNLMYFNYH